MLRGETPPCPNLNYITIHKKIINLLLKVEKIFCFARKIGGCFCIKVSEKMAVFPPKCFCRAEKQENTSSQTSHLHPAAKAKDAQIMPPKAARHHIPSPELRQRPGTPAGNQGLLLPEYLVQTSHIVVVNHTKSWPGLQSGRL